MTLVDTIPYNQMDFVWVSNHYDIHLSGLCKHKENLCWFVTEGLDKYDEENDEWVMPNCNIYSLTLSEKIKLKWRQKRFEWMVGYHWTYPYRKQGAGFHIRKPKWLFSWLFKRFYKK